MKPKLKRFLTGLSISIGIALLLALAYVLIGVNLTSNSQYSVIDNYVYFISLLMGILVTGGYFLYFKDYSESLAILITLFWSLFLGLEDLFVYLLLWKFPPDTMIWLNNSLIGYASNFLGFTNVSNIFLILFVIITGIIVFFIDWKLFRMKI